MPLREAPLPSKRVASARHYAPAPAAAAPPVPPHRPPRSSSISTASARKPPEPLRRAVADCLSPPAPHTHGPAAAAASAAAEASRTLRVRGSIGSVNHYIILYYIIYHSALYLGSYLPALSCVCKSYISILLHYKHAQKRDYAFIYLQTSIARIRYFLICYLTPLPCRRAIRFCEPHYRVPAVLHPFTPRVMLASRVFITPSL